MYSGAFSDRGINMKTSVGRHGVREMYGRKLASRPPRVKRDDIEWRRKAERNLNLKMDGVAMMGCAVLALFWNRGLGGKRACHAKQQWTRPA